MKRVIDSALMAVHPDNSTSGPNDIVFPTTEAKRHPTETMRAIVWHGTKDMRLETVPRVQVTDPKDALVKMRKSAICGTDLHLYHGEMATSRTGDIVGHEVL
jgi:hypothetical protein